MCTELIVNPLTQLLQLCKQLQACSDEELRRQLQQMVPACPEQLVQPMQLLVQRLAAPEADAGAQALSLLSEREREVLALLARGYTLPRIGEQLFISTATVNNHCARMRKKLGLQGCKSLLTFASDIQNKTL